MGLILRWFHTAIVCRDSYTWHEVGPYPHLIFFSFWNKIRNYYISYYYSNFLFLFGNGSVMFVHNSLFIPKSKIKKKVISEYQQTHENDTILKINKRSKVQNQTPDIRLITLQSKE